MGLAHPLLPRRGAGRGVHPVPRCDARDGGTGVQGRGGGVAADADAAPARDADGDDAQRRGGGTTGSRTMLIVTFAFLLLQPLLGILSDRIGRRTNLLIFSGGMTLFAVPPLRAIGKAQTKGSAPPL